MKAVDKREGGGSHNWGTLKDGAEEQLNESAVSDETQEWAEKPEGQEETETPAGDEAAAPVDPETPQMTLDEWKAEQKKKSQAAAFNIRRAGEGCNDPTWKKMHVLKKKAEDDSDEESEEEDDDDFERRRAKQTVPIQICFNDPAGRGKYKPGGRGRGGEGRGRGGGRGEARGGGGPRGRGEYQGRGGGGGHSRRGMEPDLRIQDENDFPALGGSS